ncbi:MAG: RNA methyltransferase [Halanaerobiaceae bacterium]
MGRKNAQVSLALIHHPIYNKHGEKITSTVTNLDLHDISRAGKTYDIDDYFVVNHLESQQALVKRMKDYWTGGYGAEYNENRHDAFSVLEIVDTLDCAVEQIKEETGQRPRLIATDASPFPNSVSYSELRDMIFAQDAPPYLIIFGTGWGLTEKTLERCDYILEPIYGRGDFNHLSVRSAASIILDRLLGPAWW